MTSPICIQLRRAQRQRRDSAFLLAIAMLVTSCASLVDQRVQSMIERELPCIVGPAERYDVQVSGSALGGSRFERVRVIGYRVARAEAPIADTVSLDMRDVNIDRDRKALASIGQAHAELRILRTDLASYLERSGRFENVTVFFYPPNSILIDGRPRIAGIALPVVATLEARGRIVARREQLRLELDDLRAAGFSAPALWRGMVQLAINPLIDTKTFLVPTRFDAVNFDGDALVISASGAGAASPDAQKEQLSRARAQAHCGGGPATADDARSDG